ncbi:hypothetical protein LEP1GSC035_2409 [Leptospira noguchii str. 2007001578]|uniref:Uncharacterized protein n=2 Tax=Leptospira noguchii TaxID=28182 RepID=M6YVB5_9LEPT|nr:hypothetical protein LEP1GSC035_2409 [Leptospira noguchii str. 2007001578]EMO90323.1 hypothetical protein LEP1GSC024_4176 [Leptospira noguchii str. 2001034031]
MFQSTSFTNKGRNKGEYFFIAINSVFQSTSFTNKGRNSTESYKNQSRKVSIHFLHKQRKK